MIRLACLLLLVFSGAYVASIQFAQPICAAKEGCEERTKIDPNKVFKFPSVGNCTLFESSGSGTSKYTAQVVSCVRNMIDNVRGRAVSVISGLTDWVVVSLATIAILFLGFRMVGGDSSYKVYGGKMIFKIGFAAAFASQFELISGWVMGTFDELMGIAASASGAQDPWGQIDALFDKLLGIGGTAMMVNGVVGLLGAAATSSTVGIMMFTTGMIAIINMLLFVMKMVYTYLLAYLTITFLLIFSAAVIPLVILTQTDRFFRKWVALIISAALTPFMIFLFVGMMMNVFATMVDNVFVPFGGKDFRSFWRNNQPVFSWKMPSDPNITKKLKDEVSLGCDPDNPTKSGLAGSKNENTPPSQLFTNPLDKNTVDASPGQTAGVDFGPNEVSIIQEASIAFIALWFFASFMTSVTASIPQIAASIAGAATGIGFGGSPIMGAVEGGMNKIQQKASGNAANDGSKYDKLKGQMSKMVGNRK